MRFNIISNISNGVGLQRDYELLRAELETLGHVVYGVQFNRPIQPQRVDVNIFLEVVVSALFPLAQKQWAVPNPEWWFQSWDHYVWDRVLAKTHDCERIFYGKVGDRCSYLGWKAKDLYQEMVPRAKTFLHVAGKSRFKNTPAVIEGARLAGVPIKVISEHYGDSKRVSEASLVWAMNHYMFHVMPSAYEGFGQVLHEALGTGQIILTTDAPPMNEVFPSILIPSLGGKLHHAGILNQVSPQGVAAAIRHALQLSAKEIASYQIEARTQFHISNHEFTYRLEQVLGEL